MADALLLGGVAPLLPEFHLMGSAVQHHHLTDAEKIADRVDRTVHRDGDFPFTDLDGDRQTVIDGTQRHDRGVAAGDEFINCVAVGVVIDAYGGHHVAGAKLPLLNTQAGQIGGGQLSVVRADGCIRQDHNIAGDQPSGFMRAAALSRKAKALLSLRVDMGHDAVGVCQKHGVSRGVHNLP